MKSPYNIIKSLVRTEKETELLLPFNKYVFLVSMDANKIEIKRAVEEIYKVKVDTVNTNIRRGKQRRVRYQLGLTPDEKRAIVTLKEGHKIDLT